MRNLIYILFIVFLAACVGSKSIDRSVIPVPGPAPAINLGESQNFQLANGLVVIVVANHKLPRVSYQLSSNRIPPLEGDKAGVISMMGDLLKSGTKNRSKAEIDESIDFIGASLSTSANSIFGRSLTKHQDAMLELMSDVLTNPTFPESEVEKAKKQTLSGLASAKTDPNTMSSNIRSIMRYGKNHPYGEIATEESVAKITQGDLRSYYREYYAPGMSTLVIVGDISLEDAKAKSEKYFGSWSSPNPEQSRYDVPQAPAANTVALVPLADAVQSVISVTYPVNLKPGDDDVIAASVMNSILGGGVFSGRLMQNLREDKAYTYGARSSLSPNRLVGSFSAGCSARNEVTDSAITQILFEMRRLTEELVPDSTIQFVKNSMNGSFARSLERPETIARFARNIQRYNLPADYYATYLERLEAVTAEDVMAAAREYIKPDNCYITVVGNKDEVAEKLAVFSPTGEVEILDMYGNEWTDLRPVPEGVNLGVVLDSYYEALGGADKVAEVTSYKQKATMSVMGTSIDMIMMMKDHNKYKMEMLMGGSPLVARAFNGTTGSTVQMGTPQPMSQADMEELKFQADLLGMLRCEDHGITASLLGIDNLNDLDVYVVELIYPSGNVQKDYYSLESGLKVQVVRTEVTEVGSNTSITEVTDYMEVEGLKFASAFTVSAQGQESAVEVKEVKLNVKISDSEFDL